MKLCLPIETDRLILRRLEPRDEEDLYAYLSDEEVVHFEPYLPMNREEVHRTLQERMASDEFLAVEEKESRRVIGNLYLADRYCESAELGYVFCRAYWGKGYAAEAAAALCRAVFAAGVHRMEANCDPQNEASWKLLERLGFVREGHLKQDIYFRRDEQGHPIWKDTYIYSKLNEGGR